MADESLGEEIEKLGRYLFPEIKKIGLDDVEDIILIINKRWEAFPKDGIDMAVAVALMNYGDGFTEVECVNGEWAGIKKDIRPSDGIPKCPNGHVMLEKPGRWVLALVKEN